MKRVLLGGLAPVVVGLLLVGCGGDDSSAPQKNVETIPKTAKGTTPETTPKAPAFIASPNNNLRVVHMTLAVTLFTLFHELGHMVVEEYRLPMIGQRENSADRFATYLMTPLKRPANAQPDSFDPATDPNTPPVIWAAWWWHELWKKAQERNELPDYANRHGLDISRAVEVMCLTYGTDPRRFEAPFRTFLSKESRPDCVSDSASNRATWQEVLAKPSEANWWKYEARVTHNPATTAALEPIRNLLVESNLLQEFAKVSINQLWVPKHAAPDSDPVTGCSALTSANHCRVPIEIVADECLLKDGTPDVNAYWVKGGRTMVLCYGWVQLIQGYSRDTIARTQIGQSEKMPDQKVP